VHVLLIVLQNKTILLRRMKELLLAWGLATGYYLATGKVPLVYMQNSGLGNALNPLLSLADKNVYAIPLAIFIGWRGEPGEPDEPQHWKQGKLTLEMLATIGLPYTILSPDEQMAAKQIADGLSHAKCQSEPFVFIVRKGIFADYGVPTDMNCHYSLTREIAIRTIVDQMASTDIIVATTGMASRELYEYRDQRNETHERDFLTVGSMGHASQIALAIAMQKKQRQVYCFDGDGAVFMHMGGLATIANANAPNLRHIVLNNGVHDSVGGQPTLGFKIDLSAIAKACGYAQVLVVQTVEEIKQLFANIPDDGPTFIEVRIRPGHREGLSRPKMAPAENKACFMNYLKRY
jgi:phosphonopyruvate decarboxylase